MRVTIRNEGSHLLICVLNSGRTIHLAPGETFEPLDHLEISENERLEPLARAGMVAVEPQGLATEPRASDGQPRRVPTDEPPAARPDGRIGKASLARFQLLIFSFVVTGLYLPLSIQASALVDVPPTVLGLLGISAGSYLVAKAVGP